MTATRTKLRLIPGRPICFTISTQSILRAVKCSFFVYLMRTLCWQDILILGASQDHFVDYRTVDKLIRMLTNVRSLTFRLMTEAEQASNHCNCGNSRLVLDTVTDWIFMMKRKR